MMEDEVVRRRGWLTREQFLDYLGATNLIPGPNSTEMAIHIGYGRRGWPGLILAGVCFILPAALIVSAFAWAYVRFGTVPAAAGVLYGVKPVVIGVVVQALWGLGRSAVKTPWLGVLGAGAVVALAPSGCGRGRRGGQCRHDERERRALAAVGCVRQDRRGAIRQRLRPA